MHHSPHPDGHARITACMTNELSVLRDIARARGDRRRGARDDIVMITRLLVPHTPRPVPPA